MYTPVKPLQPSRKTFPSLPKVSMRPLVIYPSLLPVPRRSPISLSLQNSLHFLGFYVNGIIEYILHFFQLFSLSMILWFTNVCINNSSFSLLSSIHCLTIQQFVDPFFLMSVWVVSSLGLLQINLPWIVM